jgi:hypothetical protein
LNIDRRRHVESVSVQGLSFEEIEIVTAVGEYTECSVGEKDGGGGCYM